MKNDGEKKFSGNLLQTLLRGLAIFAVFGVSMYAYAVTFPTNQPNAISGIVGLYVGQTSSTYDGSLNGVTGGYTSANTYCDSQYSGSHICTSMEIINTYNHNPNAITGVSGSAWINNGPPAFTQDAPNDCNGWTDPNNTFFGTSWNFSLQFGTAGSCNLQQAFACCR